MAWDTFQICDSCWEKRQPGREPVRVRVCDREECAACGSLTQSGIFVRMRSEEVEERARKRCEANQHHNG